MLQLFKQGHDILRLGREIDFIAPLLLRLYLVPIFWMAGSNKLNGFDSIVEWFGESGLDLPFPALMAFLATWTELLGAVLLLLGLAVSWIAIPLMITMLVAAITVHWQNGWLAIAEGSGIFASERTMGAIDRLSRGKEILQEHGHYSWLTENGSFVISNNGIEFSATYFIMLMALFVMGGGRFVSLDYWCLHYINKSTSLKS